MCACCGSFPVDDRIENGDRTFAAVAAYHSNDSNYAAPIQQNTTFAFTVIDNDRAGVASTATSLVRLSEGSTTVVR